MSVDNTQMAHNFPKEIGDQIEGGIIVHKEKMAGITFYIAEDHRNGMYRLFSQSRKRPLQECHANETDPYFSREEAVEGLAREQANLEQVLKNKRDDIPTPRQLYFLFVEKVPIPINLTWGQASDLIEDRLVQKKHEKQNKHAEKFDGLQVGMRVYQHFEYCGKWITHRGVITKLTSNNRSTKYAYVKWKNSHSEYEDRVSISTLRREIEGEPLKPTARGLIPLLPDHHGEKVYHPQYGEGTILHAGRELAGVQFQDSKRMVNVTDLKKKADS